VPHSPGDIVLMSPRDPAKAYVQVLGQIAHAGPVAVPPGGATLQYVLTQAGGAIPSAALSHVQVVHGKQTQTLNLHPLLFDISAPVAQTRVAAGDIVFVPLNNNHVDFYGEINAPGEMTMPDGEALTLTRAIALRSGVTHDADQRIIGIVRRDNTGHQYLLPINTDDLLKARNKGQDIALLPDDRVVIPKRTVHGGRRAVWRHQHSERVPLARVCEGCPMAPAPHSPTINTARTQ